MGHCVSTFEPDSLQGLLRSLRKALWQSMLRSKEPAAHARVHAISMQFRMQFPVLSFTLLGMDRASIGFRDVARPIHLVAVKHSTYFQLEATLFAADILATANPLCDASFSSATCM
jgi:hypothetical protein